MMGGAAIGKLGVRERVEGEGEKMRAINLGCLVLQASCSKKKKKTSPVTGRLCVAHVLLTS